MIPSFDRKLLLRNAYRMLMEELKENIRRNTESKYAEITFIESDAPIVDDTFRIVVIFPPLSWKKFNFVKKFVGSDPGNIMDELKKILDRRAQKKETVHISIVLDNFGSDDPPTRSNFEEMRRFISEVRSSNLYSYIFYWNVDLRHLDPPETARITI